MTHAPGSSGLRWCSLGVNAPVRSALHGGNQVPLTAFTTKLPLALGGSGDVGISTFGLQPRIPIADRVHRRGKRNGVYSGARGCE